MVVDQVVWIVVLRACQKGLCCSRVSTCIALGSGRQVLHLQVLQLFGAWIDEVIRLVDVSAYDDSSRRHTRVSESVCNHGVVLVATGTSRHWQLEPLAAGSLSMLVRVLVVVADGV